MKLRYPLSKAGSKNDNSSYFAVSFWVFQVSSSSKYFSLSQSYFTLELRERKVDCHSLNVFFTTEKSLIELSERAIHKSEIPHVFMHIHRSLIRVAIFRLRNVYDILRHTGPRICYKFFPLLKIHFWQHLTCENFKPYLLSG